MRDDTAFGWPFVHFPRTHGAAAAGSRRRKADGACALGRTRSAPAGDAPSDSSSRLLFGNRSAADTRSTPGEGRGGASKVEEDSITNPKQMKAKYLQTEAFQHLLNSRFVSRSLAVRLRNLLCEHVHIDELKISYCAVQHACPCSHGRLSNDVNHVSHLKKLHFIRLKYWCQKPTIKTHFVTSLRYVTLHNFCFQFQRPVLSQRSDVSCDPSLLNTPGGAVTSHQGMVVFSNIKDPDSV